MPKTHVSGHNISSFSRAVVESICREAHLEHATVTSVRRTVEDQARIFFNKHVKGGTAANYKNPGVATMIQDAKASLASGKKEASVVSEIATSITNIKGGSQTVSNHLTNSPFVEIFDIAHYSFRKGKRINYMSHVQAVLFLKACRKRFGFPIKRLGHSKELGFEHKCEFADEKCFHFEVIQPTLQESDTRFSTIA